MPGPGRRWGWHQLDGRVARRVVADAGIGPGDLVVDLGAGAGVLTGAALSAGAHVVAIELHPGRAAALRERYADRAVTVTEADVVRAPLPHRRFVVVANPPWSSLEQIRARLMLTPSLGAAHLVVPRWLAHRWASSYPGVTVGRSVRAAAFSPPAPTGAAVVTLRPRGRSSVPTPRRQGGRPWTSS